MRSKTKNRSARILCLNKSLIMFGLSLLLAVQLSRNLFSVSIDNDLPFNFPIRSNTLILSSTFPCSYSHLGDSGTINGKTNQMRNKGVKHAIAEYFQFRKYHEVIKYKTLPNVQNKP